MAPPSRSPDAPAPRDPVDPLDAIVGYQLRRVSALIVSSLNTELAERGLSVVEASVLLVIDANPGITQAEIGRMLDIHRANMAPIAAKLASMGLTRAERAGRSTLLRLSTRGERSARAARAAMERSEARFLRALEPDARGQLLTWLHAMRADVTED